VTSSNIESALGFAPIGDAPSDGSQYARKDAAWEAIQTGNPFDQSLNTTDDVSFNSAVILSQLYTLGNLRVGSTDNGDDTFVLNRTQASNFGGAAFRIDHEWNNPSSGVPKALQINATGQTGNNRGWLIEATFGGSRVFGVDPTGGITGSIGAGQLTGTLADARLSSNVSLDNINNNFTAGQTITAAANTSALTASYSVTGANTTPLFNLSGTWNTTGIARGLLLNVTDTASESTSSLMDLGVGSRTQYALTKSRQLWLYNSSPATQDASNYERGFFDWTTNANILTIGTQAAGTGTARRLRLQSAESVDIFVNNTQRTISTAASGTSIFSTTNWLYYSGASDPTTATSPFNNGSGTCALHRNTTSGVVKLWVNNNGTMVSVALA
jgi:hypothetical protein